MTEQLGLILTDASPRVQIAATEVYAEYEALRIIIRTSVFRIAAGAPAVTSEGGRAVARGERRRTGWPRKLAPHQEREAIKRCDRGVEMLAEIARSYNVSGHDFGSQREGQRWTKLAPIEKRRYGHVQGDRS